MMQEQSKSFEEHLKKSDAIFLQAPGLNKTIFVGEERSLNSFQKKIINIFESKQIKTLNVILNFLINNKSRNVEKTVLEYLKVLKFLSS